ncbi:MAG: hypothetical protein AAF604_22985 [Acidobacteriota bacterium]
MNHPLTIDRRPTPSWFRTVVATATAAWLGAATLWAAGGALQTISNGGKESNFLDTFVMTHVLTLDRASLQTLCSVDPPANINCGDLPGGLDHVVAGTGLRNFPSGTIAVRGVPVDAVAVRAFVVWGRITDRPDHPDNLTINFAGQQLTGRLMGVADQPCWNDLAIFAGYAADVPLSVFDSPIVGDYPVSLAGAATSDGRNPFTDPTDPIPLPIDDGASLILIYSDASVPMPTRVSFHEGPFQMRFGAIFDHLFEDPFPPTFNNFRVSRIGADGQTQSDNFNVLPYTTDFGPRDDVLTAIRGPYTDYDRSSDFQGIDGAALNQLWDSASSSIPASDTTFDSADDGYIIRYTSTDTPPPCCCAPPGEVLLSPDLGDQRLTIGVVPTLPEGEGTGGGECNDPPQEGGNPEQTNPRTIPNKPTFTPQNAPAVGDTVYFDCVVVMAHVLTIE